MEISYILRACFSMPVPRHRLIRRDGRAVECTGLENQQRGNLFESSNLSPSAILFLYPIPTACIISRSNLHAHGILRAFGEGELGLSLKLTQLGQDRGGLFQSFNNDIDEHFQEP